MRVRLLLLHLEKLALSLHLAFALGLNNRWVAAGPRPVVFIFDNYRMLLILIL